MNLVKITDSIFLNLYKTPEYTILQVLEFIGGVYTVKDSMTIINTGAK